MPMSKIDPAKLWSLNYRMVMSVIGSVSPEIAKLGLEVKALFLLAELDAHPHPAELAEKLQISKNTVSLSPCR